MAEPGHEVGRAETMRQEAPVSHAQKGETPGRTWSFANEGLTTVLERPGDRPDPPPDLTPTLIMQLQRTSGNASVAALLADRRRASVQRCPDHSCGGNCTHAPADDERLPSVQRFGLDTIAPAGVAVAERLLGRERETVGPKPSAGPAPVSKAPAPAEKPASKPGLEAPPMADVPPTPAPQATTQAETLKLEPAKPDQSLAGAAPSPGAPPPQGGAPASSNGPGGSPMQLLQSLGHTPVSALGPVLGRTREAANLSQVQEVVTLVTSFPSILQPTGLPAIAERKPAPATVLPDTAVPEPKTAPDRGPAPELEQESQADGAPSAGERPRVQLTGEADPGLNASYHTETDQSVAARSTAAETAARADFGESQTYPTVERQMMHPAHQPSAPAKVVPAASAMPPAVPAQARAEFDQAAAPWLSAQVAEQAAEQRQHEETFAKSQREARQAGQQEIEEQTGKARAEQQQVREQARATVDAERSQWRDENKKVADTYQQQATDKRREVDQQVATQAQTADQQASQTLVEAETRANQERAAAEAKAAQAKKDAESKDQSLWDKAKGAVSSAFDAVKGVVAGIFDGLRSLVKGIIDVAKKAAHAVIDAARTAIVGLIKGFGTFLKGLVSVALFAFPQLAAKFRARIDAAVNAAGEAVNKVADALKTKVDAALDRVGKALDSALRVLQTAFNAILSGLEKLALLPLEALGALAKFLEMIKPWEHFLDGAKKLEAGAEAVIEQIKTAIGAMILQVPAQAEAAVQLAIDKVGGPAKKHLQGVLRHLREGLGYLKEHWWEEVKKTGWHLLWPWPTVWEDLKKIWTEIKATGSLFGSLEISKGIDHTLKIFQLLNGVAGNLYGWFFIGSILVGGILGGIFGVGAGAVPGAMAGLALAAEVGEGLLGSLIATETLVIGKAVYDLAFGSGKTQDNEDAYARIAGSGLTLGITGALMVLGEIAADIAKTIFDAVVDLLRGEKPAVEIPVETGAKGEPATGEPGGEAKPAVGDQRVLAEEPTADGQHEIKVTEDGACLICSTCEEVRVEYGDELKRNPDLDAELKEANAIEDASAKAKKVQEIESKLSDARAERNTQVKDLEFDPDQGGPTPKSPKEARDALSLQDSGEIEGPIRRANGKVDPRENGADFVDGKGDLWDHKFAVSRPKLDVAEFIEKIENNDFANGEKIILNHEDCTPKDLEELLKVIDAKGYRPRFKFVPPIP